MSLGSDKVAINTIAIEDPKFVETAAKEFGSQCIVISIDVKRQDETLLVMGQGGKQPTTYAPEEWASKEQDSCG